MNELVRQRIKHLVEQGGYVEPPRRNPVLFAASALAGLATFLTACYHVLR